MLLRLAPMADGTLRERLVEQAAVLTAESGWAAVTMGRLASRVGVSRQTVYNEIGTKPALAEAMVMRELSLFLDRVEQAFVDEPDLVRAIRGAAYNVLVMAQSNGLLRTILRASHAPGGSNADFLPLFTTESGTLIAAATSVVRDHLDAYDVPLSPRQIDAGLDMVVRLVLSHVMQPGQDVGRTADDIAWIAGRVLGQVPVEA